MNMLDEREFSNNLKTITENTVHISGTAWIVQKCSPNPEAGVVKISAIEYKHCTSSSMMHNHQSQHCIHVQQRLWNEKHEKLFSKC
jgi:hypothetical protein